MAITPLGSEQLLALLDDATRIVISNRAPEHTAIVILSVAVALHGADGSPRFSTTPGLWLRPGESEVLDDLPPAATPLVAAEIVMRLFDGYTRRLVEGYATIEGTSDAPLGAIEFGIVATNGDDSAGAIPLAGAPEFAVFARGES